MDQWTDLRLDEETDRRLTVWGQWARGQHIRIGDSGESGYMRERLPAGADSDEFTEEIEATEKAVARTRNDQREWWRVLARYYMSDLSPYEIAKSLRFTEGYTRLLLMQAVNRVAHHVERLAREKNTV